MKNLENTDVVTELLKIPIKDKKNQAARFEKGYAKNLVHQADLLHLVPDKGFQYLTSNHLIRIEKKNWKMEKLGSVTLKTLSTPKFISIASEQLLNLWADVVLFEPEVCLDGAKRYQKHCI